VQRPRAAGARSRRTLRSGRSGGTLRLHGECVPEERWQKRRHPSFSHTNTPAAALTHARKGRARSPGRNDDRVDSQALATHETHASHHRGGGTRRLPLLLPLLLDGEGRAVESSDSSAELKAHPSCNKCISQLQRAEARRRCSSNVSMLESGAPCPTR
jgi:hypothetical protein